MGGEPQSRIVGVYAKGAPRSRYRTHASNCRRRGASCCPMASVRVIGALDAIRTSQRLADKVATLRAEADADVRETLKQALPAVTASALYIGPRESAGEFRHSGVVALDFDGLDDVCAFRAAAAEVRPTPDAGAPCTIGAFVSPSGDGVKVWAHISPLPRTPEEHYEAYLAACSAYAVVGQADVPGSSPTHLCFMSYDPEIAISARTWAIQWRRNRHSLA